MKCTNTKKLYVYRDTWFTKEQITFNRVNQYIWIYLFRPFVYFFLIVEIRKIGK